LAKPPCVLVRSPRRILPESRSVSRLVGPPRSIMPIRAKLTTIPIQTVRSGHAPLRLFGRRGTGGRLRNPWGAGAGIDCLCCDFAAVTERPERTTQGYHRFRCRDCGKQFSERSSGSVNRTEYPSDLSEIFLRRGIVFSYTDWNEHILTPGPRSGASGARQYAQRRTLRQAPSRSCRVGPR
jgi:hypothetical protein